ncbi:MAG TPA: hypothetical protein VEA36_00345 [Candidatus Paceibacterota bacterium]|nr:hypothetical protein [Candidatus Paceibacterota bacterium]
MRIGFIGQGYIGKNYADDFEKRGYDVVRYALEEPYVQNKELIKDCDVVFIGVPTPTVPDGAGGIRFDDSIVRGAVGLVGVGKIAVIKSTVLPGRTVDIQKQYPDRIVIYSPEFLREVRAAEDVANPFANIMGVAVEDDLHREAAETVIAMLPPAPYASIITSTEAELVKYAHNGSGYTQIVFFNFMYDLAQKLGYDWERIGEALRADPLISHTYSNPVHKAGRGAGGHCFVKDFAALRHMAEKELGSDHPSVRTLQAAEAANRAILAQSGKDKEIVDGVYGPSA